VPDTIEVNRCQSAAPAFPARLIAQFETGSGAALHSSPGLAEGRIQVVPEVMQTATTKLTSRKALEVRSLARAPAAMRVLGKVWDF